jgi:hypothetical protein
LAALLVAPRLAASARFANAARPFSICSAAFRIFSAGFEGFCEDGRFETVTKWRGSDL